MDRRPRWERLPDAVEPTDRRRDRAARRALSPRHVRATGRRRPAV